MPHVYLPGYHVGAQLKISHPEMEKFVKGKGAIGDYLWHLYTNNPLHEMFAITEPETKTWVIWDIINVAWLFDEKYVSTHLTRSPILNDDLYWEHDEDRHRMLEAFDPQPRRHLRGSLSRPVDRALKCLQWKSPTFADGDLSFTIARAEAIVMRVACAIPVKTSFGTMFDRSAVFVED